MSEPFLEMKIIPGYLIPGDAITFEIRPKWWIRILYRMRIIKPKYRQFVISWTAAEASGSGGNGRDQESAG